MNDSLTIDEYDALTQIAKGQKSSKASACVMRNTKRLSGLKYVSFAKDGSLSLTEKGTQTLFLKNCVDGLRALSTDSHAVLDSVVSIFLCKKGHIEEQPEGGGFTLTAKGQETLADIDAR